MTSATFDPESANKLGLKGEDKRSPLDDISCTVSQSTSVVIYFKQSIALQLRIHISCDHLEKCVRSRV